MYVSSVQSLSCVQHFVTPWTAACQASLSITNSQSPPKPVSIESVIPSNHLILCCPLLLLPSIFPSIRVFSSELALRIRWLKYWSFSFNISPSNEHRGLISFRMDWLDLLAFQGILKSLLQHHSSKASILWHSAFFIVQLSHPYMTTGKTIALTGSSVQFSLSVVSDSLQPHESQHTRPPCPSPTPWACSNSCPSGWWCHPTISSSVIPFSSHLQSFSASWSFQMSQLFTWGGQSIGVSASASVLPVNTQDWSPLGWTGWISLQSKGLSRVFSNTTVQKHQFFGAQLSL